jgi:putative two-component system response regulator
MGNEIKITKVLIVDDDPETVDILGNTLPKDFRRQFALSGEKTLEILAASDDLPDLILLDVIMPGMDGYKVCRTIKLDERLKDIPIIFISAIDETFDKVKAFAFGGVDYITKPFQREEVMARILTHLRLNFLQKEVAKNNQNIQEMIDQKTVDIIESQTATIYALAKLAESRDDDTGGHLERVRICSGFIALKLQDDIEYREILSNESIENIQKASLLHDIGKLGIVDSILLKPGKLSEEEFEEVKKFILLGANVLKEEYLNYPMNHFTKTVIEIVRHQHEKWDGSGYPDNLKGDMIPLAARIVAVADTYDTLRTKRPYKEPKSHDESKKILINDKGIHFDPTIIETFLECEKDINELYKNI